MVARLCQIIGELLDTRLMRNWRVWIGCAVRRLDGVLAPRSVYLIHLLGFGVVGLHLVVADGPGRRDAIVMTQFTEVLLALAIQRRTVELGRAANAVVHLRLEGFAVFIVPGIRRDIAVLLEDGYSIPVLRLARKPVTALKQQDLFT